MTVLVKGSRADAHGAGGAAASARPARHRRTARRPKCCMQLFEWLTRRLLVLQRVSLSDAARHPRRAHGAGYQLRDRPGADPQAHSRQARPDGARRRPADPSRQGRHADHGRGADPGRRCSSSTLLWADLDNRFVWVVLFTTAAFGAIGWVDDYKKIVNKNPRGIGARAQVSSGRPWPGWRRRCSCITPRTMPAETAADRAVLQERGVRSRAVVHPARPIS